ncbi:MAG: ParB/RepB/Spo0J family partition protein [Thermoleophilia bacterium]|nr:ParB/RepB/Spo0J family partition protein [Thermoleophilia bacterium]
MADEKSSSRLGRGLSVLLGDVLAEGGRGIDAATAAAPARGGLMVLSIDRISPNAQQPRKHGDDGALATLADSIATTGLIQPVVVRSLGGGNYELIAGERRWRAAQMAGLTELPAVVREADERQRLEVGLVENLVRENLNPVETAEALAVLVEDFGQSQTEVARSIGRSRSSVANLIRLLELPDDVQAMLVSGDLSEGHGRAILMADGPRRRREVAHQVREQGLSVRATERLARVYSEGGATSGRPERVAPAVADEAIDVFTGVFEAPVRVRSTAKGTVVVEIIFADEAAVVAALNRLDR